MARLASAATPIRKFLHLLVDDLHGGHTLRKIDTTPFFAAGVCSQGSLPSPAAMQPTPLPPPVVRFECPPGHGCTQFFPLGRGVEKIVAVDRHRHTVIVDTRTAAVRAGGDLRHDKRLGPAWAEAGGRLYLLGCPSFLGPLCFDMEALAHDGHRGDWFWTALPSPPLNDQTGRVVSFADGGAGAGEDTIRVSTRDDGTYVFDAARGSWRREGRWALPFHGRAQYVADYGLWFGFSGDRGAFDLCAADLACAAAADARPACRHVWADVDGLAGHVSEWVPLRNYLSYLGCGRFCVTRFLTARKEPFSHVAVVTAVEATLAAGSGEMLMVRRASRCYHFAMPASLGWAY
ncbi:hypothetical protein ACP70R_025603 [Stipagrostis hirtigluma subsp. patula]